MRLFTDSFQQLKKASVPMYRTPKSIQETIEILKVAENGIFEVRKGHYSKTYRFQDINYTTTTEGEQLSIIERYCKLLNSLDVEFKITLNNKNKDMQKLRKNVFLKERQDSRKLYVLLGEILTERERTVLVMRYGLYNGREYTQREVAAKLGISRSYISRIEKNALLKLREYFPEE